MIPNLRSILDKIFSYEADRALPVVDHSFSKLICSLAVLDKGTNSETAFIKSFSISSLFSENEKNPEKIKALKEVSKAEARIQAAKN